MSIPGIPPPTDLQNAYSTLQLAIAGGVRVVRFQDRTIEYASVDDMIKAANFIYQQLQASGQAVPGSSGGGYRQIRFYSNKGL